MRRARRDAGFTLAGLICVLSAAAITASVMVPLRAMESKREMEKELIFRGEEYVRAIQKYQRKYPGIYPAAVEDLLSRDGFRFLRKQYKDPITGEDFRLINVNGDGTLTGSVTMLSLPVPNQARPGTAAPGSLPGGTTPGTLPTAGQTGTQPNNNTNANIAGNSAFGNNPVGGFGSNPVGVGGNTGGQSTGNSSGTGGAFGGNPVGGFGSNPLGVGTNTGQGTGQPGNTSRPATGTPGASTPGTPGAASAIGNNPFTGTGNATPQITPGLAGVGSQGTGTAIMVYNTKEKYNEWEFIAPLEQTAAQNGGAAPPLGGGNGQGRPQGSQNNNQGANPFGAGNPLAGGNPFGGGNAVGVGAGAGASGGFGGNPFGGGNQSRPAGPAPAGPAGVSPDGGRR
jgi:hypothetical protein